MGFDEEEEFEDDEEEVEEKPTKPVKAKPGKKGSKKQEPKEKYLVLKQLQVQEVGSYFDEETNTTTKVQTNEEAMTDMRNILDNMDKNFSKLTGGL